MLPTLVRSRLFLLLLLFNNMPRLSPVTVKMANAEVNRDIRGRGEQRWDARMLEHDDHILLEIRTAMASPYNLRPYMKVLQGIPMLTSSIGSGVPLSIWLESSISSLSYRSTSDSPSSYRQYELQTTHDSQKIASSESSPTATGSNVSFLKVSTALLSVP